MSKPTGGPAFPIQASEWRERGADGMTLRQWYAATLVSGLISDADTLMGVRSARGEKDLCNYLAKSAFELADAMIAFEENERKETPNA